MIRMLKARPSFKCRALFVAANALTAAIAAQATAAPVSERDLLGENAGAGNVVVPQAAKRDAEIVERWNDIMLDANAVDHTPVPPGETRVFGEQGGPARTARAFAIVQIAVFDALNSLDGCFKSYTGLARTTDKDISGKAAVAQAAHDTLAAMYPSQRLTFDRELAVDLSGIGNATKRQRGVELGARAAAAILALRSGDGSEHAEPRIGEGYTPKNDPGYWRRDPDSENMIALGAFWGDVEPFSIVSVADYRLPPFPPLASATYATSFNEVKLLGGNGTTTSTTRTLEQTRAGIYWGYDGASGLGTPPRLYNQIALVIAKQKRTRGIDLARLLVAVNVAQADAGITCWENKYFYEVWRPTSGIREADEGTGPSGLGDGNASTSGDVVWLPLGAPLSNRPGGKNFTPPFPAYPSGHSTFGSALFEVLRQFYGTDAISFTFTSDELNGVTGDVDGTTRPSAPRTFARLSQAEAENAQSRIYLGVHWQPDAIEGGNLGRRVGRQVIQNNFLPTQCVRSSGSAGLE